MLGFTRTVLTYFFHLICGLYDFILTSQQEKEKLVDRLLQNKFCLHKLFEKFASLFPVRMKRLML